MNNLIFYVDGSAKKNPGPGGFGVVRVNKTKIKNSLEYSYFELCENTTNNREELKAILHVLKIAAAAPKYNYIIYSDSAYAVNICNDWIWKWASNGWVRRNGNQVKKIENLDLVKQIYDLINFSTFKYKVYKCKGHSDILENELADALAKNDQKKFDKLIEKYDIVV